MNPTDRHGQAPVGNQHARHHDQPSDTTRQQRARTRAERTDMVGNGTGLAATGRRAGRWTGRWRAGAIGLAAGLGALLTLGVASPALAHTRLVSSDPQPGTTVDHPVAGIMLSFTDPLLDGYATITVTGPDGQASAAGPAQISGRSVTQPVGALASGNYRVGWRVVSTDGHPVEGTFMFAVALPVTGAPAPSGTAPSGPAPSGPPGMYQRAASSA